MCEHNDCIHGEGIWPEWYTEHGDAKLPWRADGFIARPGQLTEDWYASETGFEIGDEFPTLRDAQLAVQERLRLLRPALYKVTA